MRSTQSFGPLEEVETGERRKRRRLRSDPLRQLIRVAPEELAELESAAEGLDRAGLTERDPEVLDDKLFIETWGESAMGMRPTAAVWKRRPTHNRAGQRRHAPGRPPFGAEIQGDSIRVRCLPSATRKIDIDDRSGRACDNCVQVFDRWRRLSSRGGEGVPVTRNAAESRPCSSAGSGLRALVVLGGAHQ